MGNEDNIVEDNKRRTLLHAFLFGAFQLRDQYSLKFLFPTDGRGLYWQCFALLRCGLVLEEI